MPAETFSDVVELMEGDDDHYGGRHPNLDIRDMYWGRDQTPFRVKLEGETRLRRVLSVGMVDDVIVVEVEGSGPVVPGPID